MLADGSEKAGRSSENPPGEPIEFRIGMRVSCSDGRCGKLARMIVDPVARAATHLVVEHSHHRGLGRLVPVALAESDGEQIRLGCTKAQFELLDDAEEMYFLPGDGDEWGYRSGEVLSWPYRELEMGEMPVGGMGVGDMSISAINAGYSPKPIFSDRVPAGDVEVRRGDRVLASDGEISSVEGLMIDRQDHHVTHVLQEGHLWGRQQIAIPIGTVARSAGAVRVKLTRQEVRDLPPLKLNPSR